MNGAVDIADSVTCVVARFEIFQATTSYQLNMVVFVTVTNATRCVETAFCLVYYLEFILIECIFS